MIRLLFGLLLLQLSVQYTYSQPAWLQGISSDNQLNFNCGVNPQVMAYSPDSVFCTSVYWTIAKYSFDTITNVQAMRNYYNLCSPNPHLIGIYKSSIVSRPQAKLNAVPSECVTWEDIGYANLTSQFWGDTNTRIVNIADTVASRKFAKLIVDRSLAEFPNADFLSLDNLGYDGVFGFDFDTIWAPHLRRIKYYCDSAGLPLVVNYAGFPCLQWNTFPFQYVDGIMAEQPVAKYFRKDTIGDPLGLQLVNELQAYRNVLDSGKLILLIPTPTGTVYNDTMIKEHLMVAAAAMLVRNPGDPIFTTVYGSWISYPSFQWSEFIRWPDTLGAPLGPATHQGRIWQRQFACGTLWVDFLHDSVNVQLLPCPPTYIPGLADNNDVITVAPNPAKDIFHLQFNKETKNISCKIYNPLGLLVQEHFIQRAEESEQYSVPVNKLSQGIYFYKVTSDEKNISSGKLIIQ
ncbi:MAG: T9SS type A sorting domain-containing protein [Bacteroidetes bacterium]|nr:T9SS type A sorting domain-containing protein [Bacteroidota bacterium]